MSSLSVNIIDDGSGNFTATMFRSPTTAASGGTALLGGGDSLLSVSTKDLGHVIQSAMTIAKNDRAAGN